MSEDVTENAFGSGVAVQKKKSLGHLFDAMRLNSVTQPYSERSNLLNMESLAAVTPCMIGCLLIDPKSKSMSAYLPCQNAEASLLFVRSQSSPHDKIPPRLPKSLRIVMLALNTIAANEPPTTVARKSTFIICIRFLLRQRSTKPSVSLVLGNLMPSGTGTSRKSASGFQPSPILYSSRFSLGTRERTSS